MDKTAFAENAPGQLIELTVDGSNDWAFVPAPLPQHWETPQELWPLLADAREALARLDGIGQTMQNYELLLRPLQSREAIRSSS